VAAASSGGWSARSRRWGRGRTKNVCLGVGLMLLLGLYLVGPGLDSAPGLGDWRDVSSIRHGLKVGPARFGLRMQSCSTGDLRRFGSRRCALAGRDRRFFKQTLVVNNTNGEAILVRSLPKFGYVLLMMKRSQGLERAE
jgi:hypothetical protein